MIQINKVFIINSVKKGSEPASSCLTAPWPYYAQNLFLTTKGISSRVATAADSEYTGCGYLITYDDELIRCDVVLYPNAVSKTNVLSAL